MGYFMSIERMVLILSFEHYAFTQSNHSVRRRQRTFSSRCARLAFAHPSDTRCDCLSMLRSCCELQASQSCDHQRGRTYPLPVSGGKRGL
ncbi:hypothetical protein M514_09922 [Trichuris suis]|uniref:Uncharacterized protein n=1 Tax=Trichuris suis TaxID=68888 RepID=A0A085N4C6_9BILA|nr:hypothetical protein M513_09922 [Trichuris suis]KFD64322.1 hypothetical protein M514_09922 [Trichuris suis]